MFAISSTLGFVNRDMTRMSTTNVDPDALHACILENVFKLSFVCTIEQESTVTLAAL